MTMSDEMSRVHHETVNKLREIADRQRRSMTATFDLLVEAEWLKLHPQPIADEESIERR